jgi:RNA polymerase sigma-70 factor (ECF subfamily)
MMVGVEPDVRTIDPRAAFESLFRSNYPAVVAYVRQVWPTVDEDEVVSRTFEIAWRRSEQIPEQAVRGWLIGVARNCALNAVRSNRRRQTYVEAFRSMRRSRSAALHQYEIPPETVDALQSAFDDLRKGDQEVLVLAAWQGLSGDDLGAALGTTASAAAVRLFRARERLKAAYARYGEES